jgi:hypothetical protein
MAVTLARAVVQMAKANVRIEKLSQELESIRLETVNLYSSWPPATSRRRLAMPAKVKSHQFCSLLSKSRTKARSQAYHRRFWEQNAVQVPDRRVVLYIKLANAFCCVVLYFKLPEASFKLVAPSFE